MIAHIDWAVNTILKLFCVDKPTLPAIIKA
nr:MAG TPA: hypothetical protein [Caudoviricetes sp.]